jgi:hypothetical protein
MEFNLKLLNLRRRRKKYIDFFLDAEPQSKKATKNKSELQKTITEKLRSRNWEGLKSKVAIEITAYSGQKNPPQIEKFVKNIVDIMHKKEILLNNEDKTYLPFKDDNRIKYLRAKYVFLEGEPSIHVKIKPFSSFISDIHFVQTELNLQYYTESSPRSNWKEYKGLIENKESYLKYLSNAAYDNMVIMKTLDVQKEICDSMSITPHLIGLLYPKRSKYIKALGLEETYRDWASMLLDVPIRIHLPGIPLKEGKDRKYKTKYKADIRKQMKKYLADHKIFNKFQSPILITAFYMPPRKRKKDYKDIDNIMLEYIMPAMNEIFHPPISLFNMGIEDSSGHETKVRTISPKSLNGSAIGYEIIELPYNFAKTDTGFIIVGFKIEKGDSSIMGYVDKEIDMYMAEN